VAEPVESSKPAAVEGWIPLAIGLSVVILLWDLLQWPQILGFAPFAFGDPGTNLTISYLVSHGYRPVIDFGYSYGLLGILGDEAWFHVLPLTPLGYQVGSILCQLGVACAIARTVKVLALGPIQVAFVFVAVGRTVMPTYWNFAHGLEAVLISLAVAEQARGARANALALTTTAVFAKPSLGFFYSALLLMLITVDLYRRRSSTVSAWLNQIKPALLVGISLCVVLTALFGFDVLWRTVVPISGMANYKAQNCGFFTGEGSHFWHPASFNWHYYAGTMIGLWLAATAYLIWGAIPAARRLRENIGTKFSSTEARSDEVVVSCVLLHLAFVFLFYGTAGSWVYYSYLLIVGAAVVTIDGPLRRAALCGLIVIAAITYYGVVGNSITAWRDTRRSPITANLWCSAQVQDEWSHALGLIKGRRAAALHYAGAVELFYPEFEPAVGTYFSGGMMSTAEINREVARIESADVIVVSTIPGWGGPVMTPETERALAPFKRTYQGTYFSVYERG
jgi:hypothetical protein